MTYTVKVIVDLEYSNITAEQVKEIIEEALGPTRLGWHLEEMP